MTNTTLTCPRAAQTENGKPPTKKLKPCPVVVDVSSQVMPESGLPARATKRDELPKS